MSGAPIQLSPGAQKVRLARRIENDGRREYLRHASLSIHRADANSGAPSSVTRTVGVVADMIFGGSFWRLAAPWCPCSTPSRLARNLSIDIGNCIADRVVLTKSENFFSSTAAEFGNRTFVTVTFPDFCSTRIAIRRHRGRKPRHAKGGGARPLQCHRNRCFRADCVILE